MLYDERRVRLRSDRDWPEYRRWALQELWPALEAAGHKPVCVLNGLIGKGVQDVLLIVGFGDLDARQAAQPLFAGKAALVVTDDDAQLLLSSPYTEDRSAAIAGHRRAIYGVRRWWIEPTRWDEFVQLSHDGIWPAMDWMGHFVLGMFCHAADSSTGRLECVNLAGYDDAVMWQATRNPAAHGVPADLLDALETKGRARNAMVLESFVCLMTAHWPDDADPSSRPADIMETRGAAGASSSRL